MALKKWNTGDTITERSANNKGVRKGLEAETKARSLRRNLENLVEMNTARRENLRHRQTILDQYVKTDVENQPGQLDDKALKEAIQKEEERIKAFIEEEYKVIDRKLENLKSQLNQIESHLKGKK